MWGTFVAAERWKANRDPTLTARAKAS